MTRRSWSRCWPPHRGAMLWPLLCSLGLSFAPSASAEESYIRPLNLRPDPLAIEPGKPLSARSLVTQPSSLADVLSWTFESRKHRGIVYCVAMSPDGTQIATGGIDGTVRTWDLATGELLRVMVGHDHIVYGVSWSPDGSVIASAGGWDCAVRLWDARRGMPLRVFKGMKGFVHHIAWSRDGAQLAASGGHSGWVWLWKVGSDKGDVVAEVGQILRSMHWAPDGQHLAFAVAEGAVTVLDLATSKASATLGDENAVNYVVRFSADGSRALVGSATQADIYAMPEGTPVVKIPGLCYSAAWSPDGKLVCLATAAGAARICDAESGKLVKTFVTTGLEHIWPAAEVLLSRSSSEVSTWDPATGKQARNYPIALKAPPVWTAGKPIVTGIGTTKLALWDNSTAKALKTLEGHTGPINAISWTKDGKSLASASSDTTVNLWQASSGKSLHTLKDHTGPVTCVAWSPDGKTLASGGGGDFSVRLWQSSGAPAGVLSGHTKTVNALVWAPRGNLLASGSADNTVRLWHDKGDLVRESRGPRPILALAFSPDGSILAGSSTDEVVRLWQTSNGTELNQHINGPVTSPPTTTALAWSPDRQLLFVGRSNHSAQLWDWQESKILQNVLVMAPADYVGVTSAGLMFVGSQDAAVRFWDTTSAELRGSILDQEDAVWILSPDGNYRYDASKQPNFVAVVQTTTEQLMLSPIEFGKKYRWKNSPNTVKFTAK